MSDAGKTISTQEIVRLIFEALGCHSQINSYWKFWNGTPIKPQLVKKLRNKTFCPNNYDCRAVGSMICTALNMDFGEVFLEESPDENKKYTLLDKEQKKFYRSQLDYLISLVKVITEIFGEEWDRKNYILSIISIGSIYNYLLETSDLDNNSFNVVFLQEEICRFVYTFYLYLLSECILNKTEVSLDDIDTLIAKIICSKPFYTEKYKVFFDDKFKLSTEWKTFISNNKFEPTKHRYLYKITQNEYSLKKTNPPKELSAEEKKQEQLKKTHDFINEKKDFIHSKNGKVAYSELEKAVKSLELLQEFASDFIIQELLNYGII